MIRAIKSCRLTSPLLSAEVISMGAALKSLTLKRPGKEPLDLVLDLGNVEMYRKNPASVGVVVGRVAGRMGGALLKMGGRRMRLAKNEGEHTLHGGPGGFGWRNWHWGGGASFKYASLHGDQGFPGHLEVKATYSMPEDHVLRLHLVAKARASTVLNLTHHPYWLAGELTVNGHEAQIVDQALISQGGYEVFEAEGDLDHCVKIDGEGLRNIAKIKGADWGLEVWSDASHAQIYNGKAGYICIEPQGPNGSPDMLNPGRLWRRTIEYRFSGF